MQVCGTLIRNYAGHNNTSVNLLPWSDHIVALGTTGSIIEQGSFAELNSLEGSYVRTFALSSSINPEINDVEPIGIFKSSNNSSNASKDSAEDKARQIGDFSVYSYYFAATGKSAMIIFWALEVTWTFLETFPSVWLKWWSSAITNNEAPSTAKYLGVYAALQVGSLVALFSCAM